MPYILWFQLYLCPDSVLFYYWIQTSNRGPQHGSTSPSTSPSASPDASPSASPTIFPFYISPSAWTSVSPSSSPSISSYTRPSAGPRDISELCVRVIISDYVIILIIYRPWFNNNLNVPISPKMTIFTALQHPAVILSITTLPNTTIY